MAAELFEYWKETVALHTKELQSPSKIDTVATLVRFKVLSRCGGADKRCAVCNSALRGGSAVLEAETGLGPGCALLGQPTSCCCP